MMDHINSYSRPNLGDKHLMKSLLPSMGRHFKKDGRRTYPTR